jgi:4-hydroxyphenylpyruvate dioxygenase
VTLYRQGDINFIVNREPRSVASYFAAEHGPSACGLAFRVKNSHGAYERALQLGAQPVECVPARWSCTCRRSRASAARRCT